MAIKTLHLTNYWHERSGGIATFYRQLMDAANDHGRRMVLVVPGERDEVREVGACCRIYKLAAPPSPLNREYRTIYPKDFLLPASKIQRILAEERPDLVEICDKYSLVHLGSLLRAQLLQGVDFRPVVLGLSCERMDENFAAYVSRSDLGQSFSRFYMRHVYFPAFDHHIAISENTAAELKAVAHGHMVPRGVWIRPMGVDVEHFSPDNRNTELRRKLLSRGAVPADGVLLLYVGRLVPEKNLDLLISTLAELQKTNQNFRLIIAGDGIARDSLQRTAKLESPGKVVFVGHVSSRDELAQLYASCDLFVHPNPAEPFGIAPLEAMASGLALIAPDRGGVASYANGANAYLAPPTPQGFAEAIRLACLDSAETNRKTAVARKTAEALAWPRVTAAFFDLYDTLHRLISRQEPIESAQPAFISSAAEKARTECLTLAADLARNSFRAYDWLHPRKGTIHLGNRGQYQNELKDMQIQ